MRSYIRIYIHALTLELIFVMLVSNFTVCVYNKDATIVSHDIKFHDVIDIGCFMS